MEKVLGNGVGYGSEVCEEKRDPILMTDCAPIDIGMKGSTVDVKVAPTLDE